jgi:hypothetical protein
MKKLLVILFVVIFIAFAIAKVSGA